MCASWWRPVFLAPVLLALAQLAGCPEDTVCLPGEDEECSCPGGRQSVRTCLPDGSGFGACDCACVPACAGLECGPDPRCGESCGLCRNGKQCTGDGLCQCPGVVCGDGCCAADQVCQEGACCTPVCGSSCDPCEAPAVCQGGQCLCTQACGDRVCGPDPVCGESCGDCDAGGLCSSSGTCEPPCLVDCADLVEIPAGTFWMGCNEAGDLRCNADEFPYREVTVRAFAIDRLETTAAEYDACVQDGACSAPAPGTLCTLGVAGLEDHPITCLTFVQGRDYCAWAGKRLCTEAEWEKAARGDDGRIYPWGNEPATCERAVMAEGGDGCGTSATAPVGSKPLGASPYGVLDMAGNAYEWVSDYYAADAYATAPAVDPTGPETGTFRVKRGGALDDGAELMRCSDRMFFSENNSLGEHGVRCCKSR